MTNLNQTSPLNVAVDKPAAIPEKPFKADLARYPARPWLQHQSIWAIAVYRFGRWNDRTFRGPFHWILDRAYWLIYRVVETLLGISFTKAAEIGPGLRIYHFGCIVIHNQVKIGANCTLRHGVTIGNRSYKGPVPTIGDNVEIGAFAHILGPIKIGDGAKIGAMSVVLQDVPPGATAVGNPARVILKKATAAS
jgi:serine O-acetyltransferase